MIEAKSEWHNKTKTATILAVVVVALVSNSLFSKCCENHILYRLSTSIRAAYDIWNLSEDVVKDFLSSYKLFEKDQVSALSEEDSQMIVNYYQVLNHLCSLGEVEKMYIPPVMNLNHSIYLNQLQYEREGIADELALAPSKKALDIGCGRGRVAHHISSYTGANVTGMNIDPTQIHHARKYAESTKMENQLTFIEYDFNDIPLPFHDEEFDGIYQIQAFTYLDDIDDMFKEIYRLLKPGGKISILDWFVLPNYNSKDPEHKRILMDTKALIGAVRDLSPDVFVEKLTKAGFKVVFNDEASKDDLTQWQLIEKATYYFETIQSVVGFLDGWLLPKHIKKLMDRLTAGGDQFVKGDKMKLFSTSWHVVAKKPEAAS